MANPFLVLGGVAVGIITAGIGVLSVPGWIASAQDSVAVNDLASIRGGQSALVTTAGAFTDDIAVLQSGQSGTAVKLGAELYDLGATDDAWCAVTLSDSGAYFATGSLNGVISRGATAEDASLAAGCADVMGIVDEYDALASWTLNCPSTTNVSLPVGNAEGVATWSDGTKQEAAGGTVPAKTLTGGVDYTVTFTGSFDRISAEGFAYSAATCFRSMDALAIGGDGANMRSAGDESPQLISMAGAFRNMANLTSVPATIPANVYDLSYVFFGALSFNGDVSGWDTSRVGSMRYAFTDARAFNGDLSTWNTGMVDSMEAMFYGADSFNQPLGGWDVSRVTDMTNMFLNSPYNQPLGSWDTGKVISMRKMFDGAWQFNQNLENWDVSSVETMSNMFRSAYAYNQPINGWDVSNVRDFSSMFDSAFAFNQPLNGWRLDSAEDLSYMFAWTRDFNQPLNGWNTSNVQTMKGMFGEAESFNRDLTMWDVSNVTDSDYFGTHWRWSDALWPNFSEDQNGWREW